MKTGGHTGGRDIVVIGASAGGIKAVRSLLGRLPARFGGSLFIVVHRSPYFESTLPAVLRGDTGHDVTEPRDSEPIRPGHVYVAPRDLHLLIEDSRMRTVRGPKEHFTRPAVDPLFRSAAETYRQRVVGVVLTGGGDDGCAGLIAIKEAGGLTFAQDPSEAEAPSMPRQAIAADDVDAVLRLDALADTLAKVMNGTRPSVR